MRIMISKNHIDFKDINKDSFYIFVIIIIFGLNNFKEAIFRKDNYFIFITNKNGYLILTKILN